MSLLYAANTTFSGKNLTSGSAAAPSTSLGTLTISGNSRVKISFNLTSLNGAAATFTCHLIRKNTGGTELKRFVFSDAKVTATDTLYGSEYLDIYAADTDTLDLRIFSSNASDTSVSGTIEWIDALKIDVDRWNGTAVASPATAGIPDVNAKNINNVATSSVTTINANVGTTQPQNFTGTSTSALVKVDAIDWASGAIPAPNVTGVPLVDAKYLLGTIFATPATAGVMDVNAKNWGNAVVTGMPMPTYTQPTGFLAATFPASVGSSTLTAAQAATAVWQDTTAGDFTVASSIGKSLYTSGVVPGASGGLLIAGSNAATTFATLTSTGAFTINGASTAAQTGDSFARIGATGSGLTSLAQSSIWTSTVANHIDVDVSSRMATYVQPTGFLAATFPTTIASPTNITAGTITTVTTLTNLPTAPTDWLTGTAVSAAAVTKIQVGLATATNQTTIINAIGFIKNQTDQLTFHGSYVNANTREINNSAAGTPGASGGLLIAGSNAATSFDAINVIGDVLLRGNVVISDTLDVGGLVTFDQFSISTTFNVSGDVTFGNTIAVPGGITATLSRVTLVDTLTTYTGNTPQTGDSFALIGSTGSGLTSLAQSATALSTAQWTPARAGYLDNINVGGAVASQADVQAINQSASKHMLLATVSQYAPDETYTVEMRTFAALTGNAVDADTTPTLAATGNISGDLNANLSAATHPATGVYRWTYTPGATPTLEQIRLDGSATIATATFTLSAYTQTVDQPTATWSSTDQGHLTAIFNKLPTNDIADQTLLLAQGATIQGKTDLIATNSADSPNAVTAQTTIASNLDVASSTLATAAALAVVASDASDANTNAANAYGAASNAVTILGGIASGATVVRANDASGNAIAPAATALSSDVWTDTLANDLEAVLIAPVNASGFMTINTVPANGGDFTASNGITTKIFEFAATDPANGHVWVDTSSGNTTTIATNAATALNTQLGFAVFPTLNTFAIENRSNTGASGNVTITTTAPEISVGGMGGGVDGATKATINQATIDAIKLGLSVLTTADVWDADSASYTQSGSVGEALATVNSNVAGITGGSTVVRANDYLGTAIAPLATAVSNADLTPTRAANLDNLDVASSTLATEADMTTALAGVAAIYADTQAIAPNATTAVSQTTPTAIADSVLNPLATAYNTPNTIGAKINSGGGGGGTPGYSGIAQAGSATTITLASSASSSNSEYVGQTIVINAGTAAQEVRTILGYDGVTKIATVPAWVNSPSNGTAYVLPGVNAAHVSTINVINDTVTVTPG